MIPIKGYYSVIQYCPDAARAEAANVGVVLFCPGCCFLQVRMAEGNDRVRRFFGSNSFDQSRLNDAKRAIENRLRVERNSFRSPQDLEHFVETRTNGIVLTSPRPMRVCNPAEELERLYDSLVGTPARKDKRPRSKLGRRLNQFFERSDIRDKILRDQEVEVPVAGTVLKAPYAFQNGKLNLIYPFSVGDRSLARAKQLAIEGDLLRRHEKESPQPAALWIALAQNAGAEAGSLREAAAALFAEYQVPVYREERLEELEADIERAIR